MHDLEVFLANLLWLGPIVIQSYHQILKLDTGYLGLRMTALMDSPWAFFLTNGCLSNQVGNSFKSQRLMMFPSELKKRAELQT